MSLLTSTKLTSPIVPTDLFENDDRPASQTVKSQKTKPINEVISSEVKVQVAQEINKLKLELFDSIAKTLKAYERESE